MWAAGLSIKMEQAKRLELIRILLQALGDQLSYFDLVSLDALGNALDAETLDRHTPDGCGPCLTALASPRKGRASGGLGRGSEPNAATDEGKSEGTK